MVRFLLVVFLFDVVLRFVVVFLIALLVDFLTGIVDLINALDVVFASAEEDDCASVNEASAKMATIAIKTVQIPSAALISGD